VTKSHTSTLTLDCFVYVNKWHKFKSNPSLIFWHRYVHWMCVRHCKTWFYNDSGNILDLQATSTSKEKLICSKSVLQFYSIDIFFKIFARKSR